MPTLRQVQAIKDPTRRATAAAELLRVETAELGKIAAVRDDAARAILAAGGTGSDVARALGVTRTAIGKRFPEAKRSTR